MVENRRRYDDPDARTGIFKTGVVSTHEGRRIALYASCRQHAGEDLCDLLQHRAKRPFSKRELSLVPATASDTDVPSKSGRFTQSIRSPILYKVCVFREEE